MEWAISDVGISFEALALSYAIIITIILITIE